MRGRLAQLVGVVSAGKRHCPSVTVARLTGSCCGSAAGASRFPASTARHNPGAAVTWPDRFLGSEERCEESPDVVQAGTQIVQNLVRVLAGCLALAPAEGNLRDDPGGDELGNGLPEHDLEDRLIVAVSGYLANRFVLAIEGRGRMVRGVNAEAEDTRDHGGYQELAVLVDDVELVQPPELLAEWCALVGLEGVHDLADVIAQPAPDGRLPGPAPHPAPRKWSAGQDRELRFLAVGAAAEQHELGGEVVERRPEVVHAVPDDG
jgi:hypothetical protein